jgi:hypothetical protein
VADVFPEGPRPEASAVKTVLPSGLKTIRLTARGRGIIAGPRKRDAVTTVRHAARDGNRGQWLVASG